MRSRYAMRRDANESELFEAARRMGIKIFPTNELGDAIAQYGSEPNFVQVIFEVKTKLGKPTPAQLRRKEQGLITRTIRTIDDVMAAKKWFLKKVGA